MAEDQNGLSVLRDKIENATKVMTPGRWHTHIYNLTILEEERAALLALIDERRPAMP